MAKKRESGLQARIRASIEDVFGGWWFKVHGGPFQVAGVPDLVGCVEGLFFSFEVKLPDEGKPSPIQLETIKRIQRRGGAVAEIVTSPEQTLAIIHDSLRSAGRLPEESRRSYREYKARRRVVRARNR